MGDFYGTGIDIWAGFGLIYSTEKKGLCQLRVVFSFFFRGKKNVKNIVVSALKSYIK